MDKKYYPLTGLTALYIAPVLTDVIGSYIADVPEYFAPGQKADWATEQSSENLPADDKLMDTFYGTKTEKIVFTVTGTSEEENSKKLGIYYDAASGRSYSTGDESPPYMALGIKMKKGKSDYVYVWFPKGTITGGNIVSETKKDNVTLSVREYTFNAVVTDKEYSINGEQKGISWVKGDTTAAAFNGSSWFNQVQNPETISAPSAIALSSSVPADDAVDIAVDANTVLTFNNKIDSESITMMKADGTIAAVTKAWDATGKILTLSNVGDKDASTVYLVTIAGVVDVYGQALAPSVISFTTV